MSRPTTCRATAFATSLVVGFGFTAASGVASAQQGAEVRPASNEQLNEQVLITKLYEAYKKADWADVIESFRLLRENFPAALQQNRELLFLNAEAFYYQGEKTKKFEQSAAALEQLLEQQPDHINGLYLLAKIRAQSSTPQERERAKDLLLQAARAGQFVLRDINSKDGQRVFAELMKDPGFILRIMSASNEFQASTSGLRNPFRSPLKEVDSSKTDVTTIAPPEEGSSELVELERRIEGLFRDIEKLASQRQVEELIGKFTELRQIMTQHGASGSDMVKKKLERWNERLAQYAEVLHSIQLQIYINEGNQHLRAMAEAIKRDEYDVALERFEQIKELKDQMYAEEREVFQRNAQALFLRGKSLADRATRLKRISEFTLDVTGIVVTPPSTEEKDSAIINDRIYREGETVRDDGDEEIEGLRVVEIVRSTVRFRYEDTEFVRELKAP